MECAYIFYTYMMNIIQLNYKTSSSSAIKYITITTTTTQQKTKKVLE